MRIRKFILFIIVTVVLIVSSLPISFAKDNINTVTSPMSEPTASIVNQGNVDVVTWYYVVQWNQSYSGALARYMLYEMIASVPAGSTLRYNVKRQQTALFSSGSKIVPYTVNLYDIESGNLLSSYTDSNFSSYGSVDGCSTSYGFAPSYFPENSAGADICAGGYPIVPEGGVITGGNSVYNSEPFVTWSTAAPEHNQYHSSLSEPVADQYNSYAVINNGLYWLSYKVNALYSYTQNIEVESSVYSGSGDIDTSGTGTYAGQNNGFTESFTVSGDILGTITSGGTRDDLIGAFESQETGNIDYTGVENGSVHLNNDGSYTYNDLEVYPVSFDNKLVSSMFSVVLVVQDQKNFYMRIIPNNSQLSGLICDIDLYASSFMLETGEYVGSFANNYTGIVNYCGAEYSLSGDTIIHDVRMYGCEFYNPNNIPCHLASVLWQYDIDFADWRSRMEQQLIAIYSALRGEDVETETYTQPSWDSDLSQAEPVTRISNDEMQSVFSAGLDDVRPSPEAQLSITGWVNMFAIPKLIAACCFALAMGTIILTLGKKKSD